MVSQLKNPLPYLALIVGLFGVLPSQVAAMSRPVLSSRDTVDGYEPGGAVSSAFGITQPGSQISRPVASATIVISEFRTRGPNGGNDEFVEIFNLSGSSVDVTGWKVFGSNASGVTSGRATIPPGVTLGSGCRYLLTNSSATGGPYSGSTSGDQTYTGGIVNDGGIALLDASNAIVDQVGMGTGSAYKEGTTLVPMSVDQNQSYERKPAGVNTTDTDNNAVDFALNSGSSNPQNSFSSCAVLAVTIVEFFAQQIDDYVLVTWETTSELGNRGFNLYRSTSAAAPDRQLNETLIPSQSPGNPGGFVYTWEDHAELEAGTTYFYWVEDVDVNGTATMNGPVGVDYTAPTVVQVSGIQASPVARSTVPLAGAMFALLLPLAGGLAVARRRRA